MKAVKKRDAKRDRYIIDCLVMLKNHPDASYDDCYDAIIKRVIQMAPKGELWKMGDGQGWKDGIRAYKNRLRGYKP